MFRTHVNLWDALVLALVLTVAVLLLTAPMLTERQGESLEIVTPQGAEFYSLSEFCEVTVESRGYHLTVVIANGEAFVKESDCPDGICRESRVISRPGEGILCAPAGVRLGVRGGDDDVDYVAG